MKFPLVIHSMPSCQHFQEKKVTLTSRRPTLIIRRKMRNIPTDIVRLINSSKSKPDQRSYKKLWEQMNNVEFE